MLLYYYRKAFATPTRMAVSGGVFYFLSMAFFRGPNNLISLVILAVGSAIFGILISKSLNKRFPEMFEDKGKEHFYRSRRYTKLLKKEELPKTKTEQKEYLEHFKTVEKFQTNNMKVFPKNLAIIGGIVVLSILIEGGLTLMPLFLILMGLFGVYGYVKARSTLRKIERLRSRIIAANPSFDEAEESQITQASVSKGAKNKRMRIIGIISALFVLLYLLGHFVFTPSFQAWLRSEYPEAFAVQEALEARYPQKRVGFSVQTQDKQHMLLVSIISKAHLNSEEKEKAGNLICTELGQNAQKYNKIVLQSTIEHRFLVFYTRQNEPYSVECPPPTSDLSDDPVPEESIPAEMYTQPEKVPDGYIPYEALNDQEFQLRVE